jgi:hypothetical protein
MTIIDAHRGDYGYDITLTLQDASGAAIDLTNAQSVTFKIQRQGSATSTSGSADVMTPATSGMIKYTVQNTDFPKAGDYYAEAHVVFSTGERITFGDIIIKVKPDLPRAA